MASAHMFFGMPARNPTARQTRPQATGEFFTAEFKTYNEANGWDLGVKMFSSLYH